MRVAVNHKKDGVICVDYRRDEGSGNGTTLPRDPSDAATVEVFLRDEKADMQKVIRILNETILTLLCKGEPPKSN